MGCFGFSFRLFLVFVGVSYLCGCSWVIVVVICVLFFCFSVYGLVCVSVFVVVVCSWFVLFMCYLSVAFCLRVFDIIVRLVVVYCHL